MKRLFTPFEQRASTVVPALILLGLTILWSGCAGKGNDKTKTPGQNPGGGQPSGTIDFAAQVQPIFDRNCSCHLSVNAPQGEILQSGLSYDVLVNVRSTENPALFRVKPGDPDSSYLVVKIDDGVPGVASKRSGDRMPRGLPPLRAEEIQTIRQWIQEGASRAAKSDDQSPPTFNGATLAVPAGPREIDLFWDFASDDRTPAAELIYKVYKAAQAGQENFLQADFISPKGASTVRASGLEPDTEYFFVVRAQDAAGNLDQNRVEVRAQTLPAPPPPASVDFDTQVLPILRQNCARCHGGFSAGRCSGVLGLCFDSFEALSATAFNGREIIPFNSSGSELVKRIRGISVPRMPFDGPPFLTEEEILTIEAWIDAGARPSPPPASNRPPVADAGGPYTVQLGQSLVFSGEGSFDLDGDSLTYNWDFGDGAAGTGKNPQHVYASAGSFTVVLVASDGQAPSAPASAAVTVVLENLFPRNPAMEKVCSQCHGVRIVLADGKQGEVTPPGKGLAFFPPGFFMECGLRSAPAWSDTVQRMRGQNGCPMTDAEAQEIVSFLSANYSGGDPRAEVFTRVCSGCHSTSIPLSVPRSPGDWQSTVDRMVRRYEAEATPAEQAAIVEYLSAEARGTPPLQLSEEEGRIYMNLVCSTCHSPARAIDGDTGLPKDDFWSFEDALDLTREMMDKGCGLRGVTDVIIARWLSTVRSPTPDLLSLDQYQYEADQGRLEVRAWSSRGRSAVLTLLGEGGLFVKLSPSGEGEYRFESEGIRVFPGRIAITSSLGGALKWHRKLSAVR